jgi:hypothetical protein
LGARPLSFEERTGGRHPLDLLDLAVAHDHALEDYPAQLLATRRCRHGDRVGQGQDAFAQLGRWRRLSRCYDGSEASARAWLEVASVGYIAWRAVA